MPFRRLLLKVMFISLAAAALLGAAGVLLASSDAVWKIVWTCIVTAVAALLLLATGFLAKRDSAAAVAAAALFILEYLLTLTFVWDVWPWQLDDAVALTMGFIAACGVPAIVFIQFRNHRAARLASRVGLVLAAADFALFMIAVWILDYWLDVGGGIWGDDNAYEIGGALAGFGILAVLCLVGAKLDRHHWRYLGVAAAAIGFAIAAYAILLEVHGDSLLFVTIIVIGCIIAHANVLLRVPLKGNQIYLRWITIAAGFATGAFIVVLAFIEKYNRGAEDDIVQRLAGASAIVAGCGSLALMVLARINRKVDLPPPEIAALREITLTCPSCQKKQSLPTGDARCTHCGLLFHIRLSEPRCPTCDYSLLMLHSDRCPECGTPLAGMANDQSQCPIKPQ